MKQLDESYVKIMEEIHANYSFIFPQELIAVREAIKPVFRKGVPENFDEKQKNIIEAICRRYGLVYEIKRLSPRGPTKSKNFIYVAKTSEEIEEAFRAEKAGQSEEFAQILGYPDCCIEFFEKTLSSFTERGERIKKVYENSRNFFFENNCIFNFDSRITYSLSEAERRVFEEVGALGCFLIFHIPCSFDCKKSKKIGKTVLKELKKEEPSFAEKVEEILKKPVLFLDDFNWAVLNGETVDLEKSVVKYESIAEPRSLLQIRELENGNKIQITKNAVKIFKNNREIGNLRKECCLSYILLPFDTQKNNKT
jgi:hypothetical protein